MPPKMPLSTRWRLSWVYWLGLLSATFVAGLATGWKHRSYADNLISLSLGSLPLTNPFTQATPTAEGSLAQTDQLMATAASGSLNPAATEAFRSAWLALRGGQPQAALTQLEGLASSLPVLADEILNLQAEAHKRAGDLATAQQLWKDLMGQFPDSPLVARALLELGQVETLRDRFPRHPATATALQLQISRQPADFSWVRDLARHHPTTPQLTPLLDRWTQSPSASLSADDWSIAANAYWEQREYGKASRAFDQAVVNPQNLYRHGRSHHLSREYPAAIAAYQALLSQFPQAEETALTRRRLADLKDPASAIALLQPLASQSTPDAAEALLSLSQIYDKSNSPQAAQSARQQLWQRFPASEAAASAAWQVAWSTAQAGNLQPAIAVAEQVGSGQQNTEMGSQLSYWAAKWRQQMGDSQGAQQAYQRVIRRFPRTYYAWRAAVQLGWPVGDFRSGRLAVQVNGQAVKLPLPEGSASVQTLYQIGAYPAAWERWQAETPLQSELSPSQVFVTGLLRNAAGDHLRGINQVASLAYLEADPTQVKPLQERPDYWQALYPLHFYDSAANQRGGDPSRQRGIAQWAEQFNLNPLLVLSLIRQESRFEPEIVSSSGALGLMQVMPSTGAWIAQQLGLESYQLTQPADNLYLGSWYLDYTHRTYDNNSLLAVASYNAGPGNVAKWVKQLGVQDLDSFVERIPFAETRGYVKSVFGNYWNYWQLYTQEGSTLVSQHLADP